MFKWFKQKYKRLRQYYLIKLAKKSGAYIPPTCKKANVYYLCKKPVAGNWYKSRKNKSYIGRKAT